MKIVLGTMTFGRDGVGARIKDPEIVKQALDEFHSHGHSELDTARMYCGGKTEEMLAEVRATAPTWPFSLATKVYPVQGGDHAPERLKATFNKSLEALQTNRVDIFYLHAPASHALH
jgi:aflatoxin B1 aldehyde reductase